MSLVTSRDMVCAVFISWIIFNDGEGDIEEVEMVESLDDILTDTRGQAQVLQDTLQCLTKV